MDGVELLSRPNRHPGDRFVGERAGGAGLHALATGHTRARPHRVVQVEGDPRRVTLARAPDHVVALDVVAGPHAAVAQDAGVVVDVDDGVGIVGAPPGSARQLGRLPGEAEAVAQAEEQVVGRRGLLRVLGAQGLVGEQQLGEGRPAPLQLRGGSLDRHGVLARSHTGGGEDPAARVHDAHSADADRVVALVVAQHRDVDAGQLGRVEDRGALGHSHRVPVDRYVDRPDGGRRVLHFCHLSPVDRHVCGTNSSCDGARFRSAVPLNAPAEDRPGRPGRPAPPGPGPGRRSSRRPSSGAAAGSGWRRGLKEAAVRCRASSPAACRRRP